jgi:hypothetical protein
LDGSGSSCRARRNGTCHTSQHAFRRSFDRSARL